MSDLKNSGQIFDDRYIRYDELGLEPIGPGTLWGMGRNSPQPVLGLGDTVNRTSMTQIGAHTGWATVGAGSLNGGAVRTNGTLWMWGNNTGGELGVGDTTNRNAPTQVGSATNWVRVESGINTPAQSMGMRSDGTIWGWGVNSSGELGLGDNTQRTSPVQVSSVEHVDFSISIHSLLVRADGTLWSSGDNTSGQRGVGTLAASNVHQQVGSSTGWKQVTCGSVFSAAVRHDGTLWTWGDNTYGQLGNGMFGTDVLAPQQVGSGMNWKEVRANGHSIFALKTDGTLWAWGYNVGNRLGLGDGVNRNVPTQVGANSNWAQLATASDDVFTAIRTDGTLWCNYNASTYPFGAGVLGFSQVGTATNWLSTACAQSSIFAIQAP